MAIPDGEATSAAAEAVPSHPAALAAGSLATVAVSWAAAGLKMPFRVDTGWQQHPVHDVLLLGSQATRGDVGA
jgi:hypothetical protein